MAKKPTYEELEQRVKELEQAESERKRAKETLRDSEERLNLVLKGGDLGLWDINLQTEETILNERWAEMLGYTLDELEQTRETWITSIHPDDRERVLKVGQDYREGRIPEYEAEYRAVTKRADIIWQVSKGAIVEWDEHGSPVRMVGTVMDITERKRAEEELRLSERRYRDLFESISDLIMIHDMEGRLLNVNPAVSNLSGYTFQEMIGRPISDFIIPEFRHVFPDEYLEQIRKQGRSEGVVVFQGRDGTKHYVEYRNVLVKQAGSEPYVSGSGRDITERVRAERALRESKEALRKAHDMLELRVEQRTAELVQEVEERRRAEEALRKAHEELEIRVEERTAELSIAKEQAETANRAKSDFLANMSHELRTPLNHIIGFTELVVDKHFGELNETQEEYLDDALSSSKHLLSLINEILDLSKVEAGKLELEFSDVNLKMLLENSLVMIKEKAMKHGIQLSTDMKGIPETIRADERKLKQIIYNLLSNAVKFTPDGGEIRLSANLAQSSKLNDQGKSGPFQLSASDFELHRHWITISVTDTGIGLKQEDLECIFNPFDQVEHSASRRFDGTGLGLSLTKSLVELHGGKIWTESEGEGKGCTFHFTMPIWVPAT